MPSAMNQMRSWSRESASTRSSSWSMRLWRMTSTVAPWVRAWLTAICTEWWTCWSSTTASSAPTSTGIADMWPREVDGATSVGPPEELRQQVLELLVGRRGEVGARGGELGAVAHHGIDHAAAQAIV